MKKLILSIFSLFVLCQTGITATYYVDQNHASANDDGSHGSEFMPWKTIQYGADQLEPGDTLIVKPGDYGERVTLSKSGSAGNWITIKGLNIPDKSLVDFDLLFDRKNPIPGSINPEVNAICKGFAIYDRSYVRIENFEIAYGTVNGAIKLLSSPNIEIKNNFIHDYWGASGITAVNNYDSINVTISNNTFYRVACSSISIKGKNWLVENNDISHAIGYNTQTGDYITNWNKDCNGITFAGKDHVIRKNYIHDFFNEKDIDEYPLEATGHPDAFQTYSVHESQYAINILFENNYCSNISQFFMCQDQWEDGGGANNVHHLTFKNNIFYKSTATALMISQKTDHFTFTNNIIVREGTAGGFVISGYSHHASVFNNIFYGFGPQLHNEDCKLGSAWDYNMYYPKFTYPPLQPEYDIYSQFETNPQFIDINNPLGADGIPFTEDDGLRLSTGSPAIGAGVLSSDMGAYGTFTDIVAPIAPSNLIITSTSPYEVNLSWTASEDNVAVHDYIIYRDGQKITTSAVNRFCDANVSDITSYTYTVSAIDFTENESLLSNSITILTPQDMVIPFIKSISIGHNLDQLIITFSEKITQASAEAFENYTLNRGATISQAVWNSDGLSVTLNTSILERNMEYILTVNNILDRAKTPNAIAPDSKVIFTSILPCEDFSDQNMDGWTIVDEGTISAPSIWGIPRDRGVLAQSSWIYSGASSDVDNRKGTYIYWNDAEAMNWNNYEFSADIKSTDSAAGMIFRYQNPSNYYKLELDLRKTFCKLFKMVDGVETTLATIAQSHPTDNFFQLKVNVQNNQITAFLDDIDLFEDPIIDESLSSGSVGVYTWLNRSAKFDNLEVQRVSFPDPGQTNQPPVISTISAISRYEGELIQFDINVTDEDTSDMITLSSVNMPSEAVLTKIADRAWQFTWQTNFQNAGNNIVTFIANDGYEDSDPMDVSLEVINVNTNIGLTNKAPWFKEG